MSLPTREEINPVDADLDGQWVCRHFLGKTVEEVVELLSQNGGYWEHFMWMGPVAFRFCFPAALQLVRQGADQAFISGFYIALTHRAEYELPELKPVARQLAELCDELADAWSKQEDFVRDVFGDDLAGDYRRLRDQFLQLSDDDEVQK